MARTNTEIIRELDNTVATLTERVDNLRAEVVRLEKALEKTEAKVWALAKIFVGAFLTLLVGLVVAWVRK